MKEIKFRLWCKDLEEIIEVNKIGFENNELWYVECIDHDKELIYFSENNDHVLMQYTGLKDKNGKEIYEGDILRTWENDEYVPNHDSGGGIIDYDIVDGFTQLGVVSFKGAWYTYETKKHLSGRTESIFAPLDFTENFEVWGNIYENPELLEGGQ
ncbi:YopX family protein [Niallia sp. FSL W8-0951]|jgi:uncharacterized phage protein (TIGR01671 family)|uniref:YopX family protein n=1 Tax=Niallia sp. FSL W8-0951 TaxID=2954639 RepID=UPI0030F63093